MAKLEFLAGIPPVISMRREILSALDNDASHLHITFGIGIPPIFHASDSETLLRGRGSAPSTHPRTSIVIMLKGKSHEEINAQIQGYYPKRHFTDDDCC